MSAASGLLPDDEVMYDADSELGAQLALDGKENGSPDRLLDQLDDASGDEERDIPTHMGREECLALVADLFPGIAPAYVYDIHVECDGAVQRIVDNIMSSATYPKQRDRKGKTPVYRDTAAEAERTRFTQSNRQQAKAETAVTEWYVFIELSIPNQNKIG